MTHQVFYTATARADLAKLPSAVSERIYKKIYFWNSQKNPLTFAKPLKGLGDEMYRFRVGDYRIVFCLNRNGEVMILLILRVKHRREVYRV